MTLTPVRGSSGLLHDRAGDIGARKLDRFLIEGDRTLIAQLGPPSMYSTIVDSSIASTYYTDPGVRFAFGRDDRWEI